MKISKREDFAIIFMSHLAAHGSNDYLSLSNVARQTGLSSLFLKHIALELKNNGLVESREGVQGGYRLKKKPEEITAAQILSAVNRDLIRPACYEGVCRLKEKNCICVSFWGKFNLKLTALLNNVTLAEIAKI
ncbi:MAG: Transcriptional regulator [Candidatus Nomurabacteria bacterium GW2011_GWC1_37_9]|uniref:BadM/Rrf2 family transcriptional regulator n=1 Tax=Candidatus Gottesmanbacteria bacterium GW2011_GWA2_43_14 TaxID=1618443 RepID=A0A0G1GC01_9BACT|nr:MAG: Transcriptional regulator [Candidatus Nomurabacteria bacterium GW2011_GWC1_37_9]KKS96453.1 MAG: BadM/Rrf2 family transcriptional regulator [Candidatus Gottesmanbacteria bacterium GW2011_GWA2_43_14]